MTASKTFRKEIEIKLENGKIDRHLYNITAVLEEGECNVYPFSYRTSDLSASISLIDSIADGISLVQGTGGEYIPRLLPALTEVNSIDELTHILTKVAYKLVSIRKKIERENSDDKSKLIGRVTNSIKAIKTLSTLLSDGEAELTLNITENNTVIAKCTITLKLKGHNKIIENRLKNKVIAREVAKRLVWGASQKIVYSISYGGE